MSPEEAWPLESAQADELKRRGYAVVRVGAVPPWMERLGRTVENQMNVHDDAPESRNFFSRDVLPEEEILFPEDFDEDGEPILLDSSYFKIRDELFREPA